MVHWKTRIPVGNKRIYCETMIAESWLIRTQLTLAQLIRNSKMRLPVGNNTPVIPEMRYQYLLTPHPDIPNDDGIYFHYDDELYAANNHGKDKNIFRKKCENLYN